MKTSLVIPSVNHIPADRPRARVYCAGAILRRHGALAKPIEDHRLSEVIVVRYKCVSCGRRPRTRARGRSCRPL
jgi:hypothetical protein